MLLVCTSITQLFWCCPRYHQAVDPLAIGSTSHPVRRLEKPQLDCHCCPIDCHKDFQKGTYCIDYVELMYLTFAFQVPLVI